MRRLIAIVATLVLVLALPAGASAAPPANDLPAGATALPAALPQTFGQDTTQATVTAPEDLGCGTGGQDQATVWYTFTPASDVRVRIDTTASSYHLGINVFEGPPTVDSLLDCFDPQGVVAFTGGTTYTLMFADIDEDAVNGGQLSVTLSVAPPPIEITVTVDRHAKVLQRPGVATVSGTISCSAPPEDVFLEFNLRQRVGKYVIHGSSGADVPTCGPEPVPWTAEFVADNGRFGGGKADLDVFAAACDAIQCGELQQTFSVRLRR